MAVNHKRVLRIMREESLLRHLKKRFVVSTTDSRHGLPVYPNVLTDDVLTAPDQAWVADVTYIRPARVHVHVCTWPVVWRRFRAAASAGICPET